MIIACFILLIMFSVIAFLLYRKSNSASDLTKKNILALLAVLVICLGLEVSLFNINYFSSAGYDAFSLNHYLSDKMDAQGEYTIISGNEIEFSDLNTEIKNIKIILSDNAPDTVNVNVYLTDEANSYYYGTPSRTIYKDVEKSQYINVNTTGESRHLKLVLNSSDYIFNIKGISINEKREFDFSFVRLAILFALLVLIHIFKPSSPIYKLKLVNSNETKNSFVTGFCALLCAVFLIIGTLNPTFLGFGYGENGIELQPLSMKHHNQYDELAQAILQGKTYIDNNDIPQSLLDLENPYDTTARMQAQSLSGDTYRWDVAFFNGHYYVYFGIVPLLIMYLPCRALLDAPFPSAFGIIIFAFIFAIGVFKLLELLALKHFKKLSLGAYLLTSLAFITCCGTMFLVKRPDFYSVPIICAMAFVVWGIFWWIKGRDAEKKQLLYFILGSSCCALAVGCRPQSVLMCAVAIPIFAEYFFKKNHILSAKGIKQLICLAIPFVVVAAGIMYYNFIRFGSPFDFGSGYNLTTNDVTKRGFDMGRTGLGLFTYLFQTPQFTATFPFIKNVDINTAYIGKTIYELCFGGLITCTPVLWFLFALPKAMTTLKNKKLFGLVVVCIFVAISTVIADTQAGGLLQRYFSDFGYIFFIAAALVIFALSEKSDTEETTKNLHILLFISTIFSVLYTICLVFSVADVTIDTQSPATFGYLKHLVEFWL